MPKMPTVTPDTTRRTLLMVYRNFDEIAHSVLANPKTYKATCQRGCNHCCKIAVVASLGECRAIANHLHRLADWATWLPKLRAGVQPYMAEVFDRDAFFRSAVNVCPFLDEKAGDCQIYEIRPSACRYHYSIDPPEHCATPFRGKIRYLDFQKLNQSVVIKSLELVPGLPPSMVPLPLGTLYFMQEHRPERQRLVLQHFEGLMDPVTWYDHYGRVGGKNDFSPGEVADLPKEQPDAEAQGSGVHDCQLHRTDHAVGVRVGPASPDSPPRTP
jgi:Fe-S-cluster containining protein